jgi:hypothetical protein
MRCWFLVGVVAFAQGCATPEWVSAPKSPNPVLLGPVDRIGGHRSEAAVAVGSIDVEVSQTASAETKNGQVVRSEASATDLGAVSAAINEQAQFRSALDVRVQRIDAGGWVMMTGTYVSGAKWVRVQGAVARVRGAR